MKTLFRNVLVCGLILAGVVAAQAAPKGSYTLIVAPARYAVMQVASDIVARHPAMLVSYQADPSSEEPLLHAWDVERQDWTRITLQEFREVSFLEKVPARTVLIGDDSVLPAVLRDSAAWSPEVVRVHTLNAAGLINEFGRMMKWSSQEWKWFAQRYNLTLNDESESLRKSSWYDQQGPRPRYQSGLLKKEPAPEAAKKPAQDLPPAVVEPAAPAANAAPAVTPVP